MTILTEEQLSKFTPELPPVEEKTDKRYRVAWYITTDNREITVVFDKLQQRVVYKGNSKSHKDHYEHIQHFYGKNNCDAPNQVNPQFYEGL